VIIGTFKRGTSFTACPAGCWRKWLKRIRDPKFPVALPDVLMLAKHGGTRGVLDAGNCKPKKPDDDSRWTVHLEKEL
jgi:hypothetical protein